MSETQTHYRTCNICEAMCGLEIQHRGSEILSIKGESYRRKEAQERAAARSRKRKAKEFQ